MEAVRSIGLLLPSLPPFSFSNLFRFDFSISDVQLWSSTMDAYILPFDQLQKNLSEYCGKDVLLIMKGPTPRHLGSSLSRFTSSFLRSLLISRLLIFLDVPQKCKKTKPSTRSLKFSLLPRSFSFPSPLLSPPSRLAFPNPFLT